MIASPDWLRGVTLESWEILPGTWIADRSGTMPRLSLCCVIATAVFVTAFPRIARGEAAPGAEASTRYASPSDTTGLRAEAATFGLVHARRSNDTAAAGTGAAPGLELGGSYRTGGAWDVYANVRYAYFGSCSLYGDYEKCSQTNYAALSAGGRWYAARHAPTAFFVELGARALTFQFDDYSGVGPAAHLGMGVEIFHDDRHHRLSIQGGVDLPTFGATRSDGRVTDGYYAVPVTAMARWTF